MIPRQRTGSAAFDAEHARRFLRHVYLDVPGWLQIVDSGRRFSGQAFPTTTAGLDAAVEYAAARDRHQPQGVYWRASTMRTQHPTKPDGSPGRGGAADTAVVPCLWADLDFGSEGHKGANNPPDQAAAAALIDAAGLPEPSLLIHSGGGLYPIWRLTVPAEPDVAARLSEGVQQVLEQASAARGWAYGTGVKDLARVLRLPGSVNRKTATGRRCRVIRGGTAHRVDPDTLPTPAPKIAVAPVADTPPRRPGPGRRGPGLLDALDRLVVWADLLEPAGWTYVGWDGDGWQRWLRPGGATSDYSARCFEHNMVCWSESAGLPSGPGQRLTKARVAAWLWHGNPDTAEVCRDLLRGTAPLPADVVAAIIADTAAAGRAA